MKFSSGERLGGRPARMAALFLLLIGGPAAAWDGEVFIDELENNFFVDTFTGSHTWTTLREGVRADSGTGSIPINYIFQDWNGSAWPSALLSDTESAAGIDADGDRERFHP